MLAYRVSIVIDAPPEAVWAVLSDVSRWPEWMPTVSAVEALDAPELSPDRRFRVSQPKLKPTVWRVLAVDAPRSFAWEARSPGLRMFADHRVASGAHGATDVTLEFRFEGWVGAIVGRLYGRLVRQYLETEAVSLRKRMTSGG